MNFKCFLCTKEYTNMKYTLKHLKIDHLLKDKSSNFECVANNTCVKYFHTFDGLRRHSEICVKNKKFRKVKL